MYLVIASSINGFRRAGVSHSTEKTYYEEGFFDEDQCRQLDDEPRLSIRVVDQVPEGAVIHGAASDAPRKEVGSLAGVVTADSKSTALAELTVKELREIAQDMGIEQLNSLNKAELVEAIKAVEVTVTD